MKLADKIILLRKRAGWSQEELAEKLEVSRQAVSKWEAAQSVPDLDKILRLSELFGVTTDQLLKEEEALDDSCGVPSRRVDSDWQEADDGDRWEGTKSDRQQSRGGRLVSMDEAKGFLSVKAKTSLWIALGVMLCILSPICIILLACAADAGKISEQLAAGGGIGILLVLVAVAVAQFIRSRSHTASYVGLTKGMLETEPGVGEMVRQTRDAYRSTYCRCTIIGVCLCILAAIPVILSGLWSEGGSFVDEQWVDAMGASILLAMVAVGVFFLVSSGIRWASFQTLLEEGDFSRSNKKTQAAVDSIGGIYWTVITAGYLLYSFLSHDWGRSWIVWPFAGILFAVIERVMNLTIGKDDADSHK